MTKLSKRKTKSIKRNYWKLEEENLLKQWAEKAQCYQWMHNRSREIYQRRNAYYTIPVIIISTLTGTTNFAQDRFSEEVRQYVVIIIGSLSIIAGIITTIYQFLKISEINEGHRVALFSWGKFHRNLESELTRHPLDRTNASELIKISKEEYNRLVEVSPFIPKCVLNEFNKKFKNNHSLTKPEIGNTINSMDIFQMNSLERQKMVDELNDTIINVNNSLIKQKQKEMTQIDKFKLSFNTLNNRYPNKEEILKHMKLIEDDNFTSNSDEESDNSIDLELGSTISKNIELNIQNLPSNKFKNNILEEIVNLDQSNNEDNLYSKDKNTGNDEDNLVNQPENEENDLVNQPENEESDLVNQHENEENDLLNQEENADQRSNSSLESNNINEKKVSTLDKNIFYKKTNL